MAFHLYVSTSLETLAGLFMTKVYESGNETKNFLQPEIVAVQTQGIAIWLKQYLAEHSRIAMNLKMPFLKSAISQSVMEYCKDSAGNLGKHSIDRDTWRIFSYLSGKKGSGELPEIQAYMNNDPDLRKQYQISRQIAAVFEQYRTYRQKEIIQEKWLANTDAPSDWQEKIFRDLFADEMTLDRYIYDFMKNRNYEKKAEKRLSLFGISSMPPLFLNFFLALSEYQEVNLFYLAPSADYWEKKHLGEEDPFSNPLLQAFGVQGWAFFNQLLSSKEWDTGLEIYPDPEDRTFLGCLQADIRNNHNVEKESAFDDSLLIESCHTPLREVEVLHDRILCEIQSKQRVPGDFLVTAPSIEKYVPYIESVFGSGPLANCYSIADRSLKDSGMILPALIQILGLPNSGYTNSGIFSLLEVEILQKKFNLESDDIPPLRAWCTAAGIRWGIDEKHRAEKCGVDFEDFSWRHGIRRLLFGYAVSEDFETQLDLSELPVDFAEGAGAEKLGNFLDFLDQIFALREELFKVRSPKAWFEFLKELPDKFFRPEELADVEERSCLIRFLAEQAYESRECESPVPFPVILDILKGAELPGNAANAFLRGKITFCSMVPMRTIPMPVIAVLGLNAGEFPRRDTVAGFNLIARNVEPTDRSKNLEDRFLLLETLIAAKEKLMIFYNGQSAKDNAEVAPTPPLAELIQYLDRLCGNSERKYLVKHHLQSYSESYFDGSDRQKYSYSETALTAAKSARAKFSAPPGSLIEVADLTECDFSKYELPDRISLKELEDFFGKTVEYYVSHQKIGKFRSFIRENPDNNEPFFADSMTSACLKTEIVRSALDKYQKDPSAEQEFSDLLKYYSKTEQLPYDKVGEEQFISYTLAVKKILADTFLEAYTGQMEEPLEMILTSPSGKEIVLTGKFPVAKDHTFSCTFKASPKKQNHLLKVWLQHLFLCAMYPEYEETHCYFENEIVRICHLEQNEAKEKLLYLISVRAAGKEMIIPFFDRMKDVGELPTRKDSPPPYLTDSYKNDLIENISYNYSSSVFFKEKDLSEEFRLKVCRAVRKVYEGMIIPKPERKK